MIENEHDYCFKVSCDNGHRYTMYGKNKRDIVQRFLKENDKGLNETNIVKIEKEWIPPLCGVKWLRKNKNKHQDFIPTIDITIDGKTKLHIHGDIKKGTLKKVLK